MKGVGVMIPIMNGTVYHNFDKWVVTWVENRRKQHMRFSTQLGVKVFKESLNKRGIKKCRVESIELTYIKEIV